MVESHRHPTSRPRPIGAVTIGQTPRDDVVPHLKAVLGGGYEIIEAGALDGLSEDEIRVRAQSASGMLLVTRLHDGREIQVRESFLTPRLQACIGLLESRVDLILLLCTGDIPSLESSRPILRPGPVLRNMVGSLDVGRLGVLTPAVEQMDPQRERWRGLAREIVVDYASPYGGGGELERAAQRLRRAGVEVVVMDCIGYTREMKTTVRTAVSRPVVLASTLLARVAAELLE